jgi:hypothetical protein
MSSEITSNNPVVLAVIGGTAPRPALLAASRGVLPLPQADLLEILVSFYNGGDTELRENARATLVEQSSEGIENSLRSTSIAPTVLAYFADQVNLPSALHEVILTNSRTPADAVTKFARTTQNGQLLELISFNQQLLIQNPAVIEAIISNANFSKKNVEPNRSRMSCVPAGRMQQPNLSSNQSLARKWPSPVSVSKTLS